MTTLFAVQEDPNDPRLVGIYSTREKAEAAQAVTAEGHYENYCWVEEWEPDTPTPQQLQAEKDRLLKLRVRSPPA